MKYTISTALLTFLALAITPSSHTSQYTPSNMSYIDKTISTIPNTVVNDMENTTVRISST